MPFWGTGSPGPAWWEWPWGGRSLWQRWARMAFWLQYQYQESWNSLKISISKSSLLKLEKNIQNQYQNSWKNSEEFNINIKIFEISAAESISISRFLKCVQNFKTKINFIEKVLEYSISKSKFLKIPWQSQHQNQDKNSWKIVLIQYQNQDSWELNQSKSRFKIKISKI